MRIGLHVSIAGSIWGSLERAKALGCNTMQIFSRNPRGWQVSALGKSDVDKFRKLKAAYDIFPVVVHIPYIINLSTPDKILYKRSIDAYIDDIARADALGAEYFVTHLGSHVGSGEDNGIRRFSSALKLIIKKSRPKTMILLENTAGSGSCIGYNFEHLRRIMDDIGAPGNMGVCFDTAHAFEAGYDLKSASGAKKAFGEFERLVGLDKIKVVHFNDSMSSFGSHADRHQHIGKGDIGKEGLGRVINHPGLKGAAFIMETPKDSDRDDKMNMVIAGKLVKR